MAKKKGITHHQGKGGQREELPSRHDRDNITGADPVSRARNNYHKNSPYKQVARELEEMGMLRMPTGSS